MFVGLVKLIAWVWIQLNKQFYFFIQKDQQPFNLQDSGAPYNVEDHLWKKKHCRHCGVTVELPKMDDILETTVNSTELI